MIGRATDKWHAHQRYRLNARRRIAQGLTAIGNDALEERSQVRNQHGPQFSVSMATQIERNTR